MYYTIGLIYLIAMVLLVTLPILAQFKIVRFARRYKGKVLISYYEISTAAQDLLGVFHGVKRESLILLYLDAGHRCIDVLVRFGNKESVHFPAKDIYERAVALKAKGLVIARNHVQEISAPSDKDVFHAASVQGVLGSSINMAGYFVWCHQRAQSVLNTHRYLQMIAGIRSE